MVLNQRTESLLLCFDKLWSISEVLLCKYLGNSPVCAFPRELSILTDKKKCRDGPKILLRGQSNVPKVGKLVPHHVSSFSPCHYHFPCLLLAHLRSLPPPSPAGQEAERSGQLKEMILAPSLSLFLSLCVSCPLSITKPPVHFDYLH